METVLAVRSEERIIISANDTNRRRVIIVTKPLIEGRTEIRIEFRSPNISDGERRLVLSSLFELTEEETRMLIAGLGGVKLEPYQEIHYIKRHEI